MDALRLHLRAKDQLHPILQELVTGYARFKGSKDWEGRSRMVGWYVHVLHVLYHNLSHYSIKADHSECHESFRRDYGRTVTSGAEVHRYEPLILPIRITHSCYSTWIMRMPNFSEVWVVAKMTTSKEMFKYPINATLILTIPHASSYA